MTMWSKLKHLPTVSPWRKGKKTLTWEERLQSYSALAKTPLTITAELVTPIIHAEQDATHIDSVLSMSALTNHPAPSAYAQAAVIPLPLELVWVSENGLPLWATTPLIPVDENIEAREYWHKRYPSQRAEFGSKMAADTSAGRWREYRVPVNSKSVNTLVALAIGNKVEIEKLLAEVSHIGKKGSMGYGRVARWSVADADHTIDDVLSKRAVPVMFFKTEKSHTTSVRGWAPPYWYAPWWSECVG